MASVTLNSESGDGRIEANGSSWSSVRNATTGSASYTATNDVNARSVYAGNTGSTPAFFVDRAFFAFDTRPLKGTPTAATLKVYVISKSASASETQALHVIQASQVSPNSLTSTDFDNVTFSSLGNIAWSSITTGAVNEITVNTSGITFSDYTKLALVFAKDLSNTEPTGRNQIDIYYSENGSNVPQLELTFTPAGSQSIIL